MGMTIHEQVCKKKKKSSVMGLIRKEEDVIFLIDFTDAYFQKLIHPNYRPYLFIAFSDRVCHFRHSASAFPQLPNYSPECFPWCWSGLSGEGIHLICRVDNWLAIVDRPLSVRTLGTPFESVQKIWELSSVGGSQTSCQQVRPECIL